MACPSRQICAIKTLKKGLLSTVIASALVQKLSMVCVGLIAIKKNGSFSSKNVIRKAITDDGCSDLK